MPNTKNHQERLKKLKVKHNRGIIVII